VDLCDSDESGSASLRAPAHGLAVLLALGLRAGGGAQVAWVPLLAHFAGLVPGAAGGAAGATCGDVKAFYKAEDCCGSPDKALTSVAPGVPCPYNFAKPACASAEPQAPRDLSRPGGVLAEGNKTPKAATLTDAQANFLPLTNVHFHLGAEHKSDDYSNDTDSRAYDAAPGGRRLAEGAVRPGFMCDTAGLSESQTAPYVFQHCRGDVQVGKSYEVHYVHSSAGYTSEELEGADQDGIDDGLGGAANGRGLLNPMIVVQGQVFQIVAGAENVTDLLHGWTVVGHENSVMYSGSTTGESHDNAVCSPYVITWHVDLACHRVSPEAFDNLCRQMNETYQLVADLYPHGSRKLLDPAWVVKAEYVKPLA